jgi:hypothetical protein
VETEGKGRDDTCMDTCFDATYDLRDLYFSTFYIHDNDSVRGASRKEQKNVNDKLNRAILHSCFTIFYKQM